MSDYRDKAKHPLTGEVENAWFHDNYYGHRQYGVRFSDGLVWPIEEVSLVAPPASKEAPMSDIDQARDALEKISDVLDLLDCSGSAAAQNIAVIKIVWPEVKRALAALARMEQPRRERPTSLAQESFNSDREEEQP